MGRHQTTFWIMFGISQKRSFLWMGSLKKEIMPSGFQLTTTTFPSRLNLRWYFFQFLCDRISPFGPHSWIMGWIWTVLLLGVDWDEGFRGSWCLLWITYHLCSTVHLTAPTMSVINHYLVEGCFLSSYSGPHHPVRVWVMMIWLLYDAWMLLQWGGIFRTYDSGGWTQWFQWTSVINHNLVDGYFLSSYSGPHHPLRERVTLI